ncbi:MAG: gamma-glutamyltransferase, partial [Chloroflexota bacterium]
MSQHSKLHGSVSSAHPLATEVGLAILQQGGNAFDAAVATAAALNVVEPMMSGLGGYGTILVYHAAEKWCRFLNASDRIPRGVNSDLFRAPTPDYKANRRGAKAISTPGNLRAWEALAEYGRFPFTTTLQPAIMLAQEGFPISPQLAEAIRREFNDFPAHAQSFYGTNGQPLVAGETLRQLDLGQSLSLIADEGVEVFYNGRLAHTIADTMAAMGSFLALEDLQKCQAEWWEPISIRYRDHEILTTPPPATSFSALIRLGLMSQFDVATLAHNSPDYLHRFAEATKHAFWCRLKYAADPDHAQVPFETLLSPVYWAGVAAQIDLERERPFTSPVPSSSPPADGHTTHFVVADADGNIVSATQTIGQLFGSRIMPEGTGIWLNNSLQYCTFEPEGNPMDAHAGQRKLSGDCPIMIMRDGQPWAALGTPGGHTIPQTMPQIVMNLLDFGLDMAEAIAAPRISFGEPNWLLVDPTLPEETRKSLAAKGHRLKVYEDG